MARFGTTTPYISLQLFRPLSALTTKPYRLVSTSLLAKYSAYFFLPKPMYTLAFTQKSTTIPEDFTRILIRVYRGRLWKGLKLTDLQTGFKLGSFIRTRTLAIFRQKATRKKKPTYKAATAAMLNEIKISKIRQIKSGQRRKSVGQYSQSFDAQFTAIMQ